jgi:EmrB/QacA subfamily drug resistance transporter
MHSRRWILAATILGSSMVFIDGSVVSIAAPALQRSLGATTAEVQWVMNAYLLLLGGLMLTGGALGDRIGRRAALEAGTAVFTVASVGCALAPDVGWLIAARVLQGVGGALLVPGSLAILREQIPEHERGRAFGTWAGAAALTTAAGPILGGWLVDAVSWRAIFLLNVPLGAATIAIARTRVPASDREHRKLDLPGAVLAIAAFGLIGDGLIAIGDGRRGHGAVSSAAGAVMLAVFLVREHRAETPMMPLGLFRSRAFAGTNAFTVLLYAAFSGALFLLPYDLIDARGYAASSAGLALLPMTLVMGTLSRFSGSWAETHGARTPMIVGPLVVAGGFALLALGGASYLLAILPGTLLLGLGMAITVAPLTNAVMGAVDDTHAGVASGINNTAARVAGLLGVALLGGAAASSRSSDWAALYRASLLGAAGAAALSALIAAITVPRNP